MSALSTIIAARSGLVGYWRQTDPSGTTMTDSASVPHNGTYTGGFTLAQSGAFPGALDTSTSTLFDGVNGVGTVADTGALDFAGDLSVSAFLFLPSLPGGTRVFVGKLHVGTQHGWAMAVDASGHLIAQFDSGSTAAGTLPTGAWCHVAIVLDYANLLRKMYVNGVLVSTSAVSAFTPTTSVGLTIGSGEGGFTNCRLQEVAYYNRQLSVAEIQTDTSFLALAFNQPRTVEKPQLLRAGGGKRATTVADANYTRGVFDGRIALTGLTADRTVALGTGDYTGQEVEVCDTTGLASASPKIIVSGNVNGSAGGTTIQTAYQRKVFVWMGSTWYCPA